MYQPIVQLKSGGYLVINPTEALVSIDINSGRSTREHNIEQTAYNTNLEAAQEIARQLRLRDMAGLIVIDFIDMEQNSHVRKVEKAMKEALKNDRARIQVGRISSFGLMEMSRQRLRTGVLEASTKPCPHCDGTGLMRTAASAGLSALRIVEDEAARGRGEKILLRAGREAAVYVLNKKRAELAEIEHRYGVSIEIAIDESFEGARMTVESSGPRPTAAPRPEPSIAEQPDEDDDEFVEETDEGDEEESGETVEISLEREGPGGDEERTGRKRRRRRRRGGRGRNRRDEEGQAASERPAEPEPEAEAEPAVRRKPRSPPKSPRAAAAGAAATATATAARPRRRSSPTARRWSSGRSTRSRRLPRRSPPRNPKPKGRRRKAPTPAADVAVAEPAPAELTSGRDRRGRRARQACPKASRQEDRGAGGGSGPNRRRCPPPNNDTAAEDELGEPRRGLVAANLRLIPGPACRARALFIAAFSRQDGKPAAMNAPVARFVRLLMLALMLAMSAWQPAAAQESDSDSGPSILRDSETELLFRDASRPLIEAAKLDPNSVKVVLAQRSRDQRLRRHRADRLCPVRADPGGGQRQPASGRHRPRARPRRRRPLDPNAGRRQIRDRDHDRHAGARRAGDCRRRGRGRHGHHGGGPAGGDRQFPVVHAHPGKLGRPGGRQISLNRRDQRQGHARFLR